VCVCVSCSVVSDSSRPRELQPARSSVHVILQEWSGLPIPLSWVPPKRTPQTRPFVQLAHVGDFRNLGKECKELWVKGAHPPLFTEVCIPRFVGISPSGGAFTVDPKQHRGSAAEPLSSRESAREFSQPLYPRFQPVTDEISAFRIQPNHSIEISVHLLLIKGCFSRLFSHCWWTWLRNTGTEEFFQEWPLTSACPSEVESLFP